MKSFKIQMIATLMLFSTSIAFAQLSKVEIVATGLTCSMCSNAINKQLKSLSDVEKVDIDLNTNTFIVFLKNNNSITPRLLKDKVENAGFFVGEMTLFMSFENQSIINNTNLKIGKFSFVLIDSKIKSINGLVKFKVMDKGYLTPKVFKSTLKLYNFDALKLVEQENVYHVKVV